MWRMFFSVLVLCGVDMILVRGKSCFHHYNVTNCSFHPTGVQDYTCKMVCSKIREIPVLSDNNITELVIVDGNFSRLSGGNFSSYPWVKVLIIKTCYFTQISDDALSALHALKQLNVSWNKVTAEGMDNLICSVPAKRRNFTLSMSGRTLYRSEPPLSPRFLSCLSAIQPQTLEFSSNREQIMSLCGVFCAVKNSTTHLTMGKLTLDDPANMSAAFFQCLQGSRVRYLDMTDTDLSDLPAQGFKHLSQVNHLDLCGCRVDLNKYNMEIIFTPLTHIQTLLLCRNDYKDFSVFTNISTNLFQRLKYLNLFGNNFLTTYAFVNGTYPLLETLVISQNYYPLYLIPEKFIYNLPSLSLFRLNTVAIMNLHALAFQSETLEHLQFQYVSVNQQGMFPTDIFRHSPKLTSLILNYMQYYTDEYNEEHYSVALQKFYDEVFQNLTSLTSLGLRHARLKHVTPDMFTGTLKLETLDLSGNKITRIADNALQKLEFLTSLDLHDNKLDNVNRSTFPAKLSGKVNISLEENPWSCTCSLYWLIKELQNSSSIFVFNQDNMYRCSTPSLLQNTKLTNVKMSYRQCFSNALGPIYNAVSGFSLLLISTSLLLSIGYRIRFHVYFMYLNAKLRWNEYQQLEDTQDYDFDAFVCYHHSDTLWVVHELRHVLEEEYGLTLCLHDRDWLPGVDIVENIVDSIQRSRKVVLVITNHFASSNWCQLELAMTQHNMFTQDRNNVILVMKEEVRDCFITPTLALQMKTQTFIPWNQSQMGQKVFWRRLADSITGLCRSIRYNTSVLDESPSTSHTMLMNNIATDRA